MLDPDLDPDPAPVLIFDLDETILAVNSFPLWVRFLIAGPVPGLGWRRRAALSLRVQSLAIRRKLGLLDHDALLRHLQRAWRRATGTDGETMAAGFQASLLQQVRPGLKPLLAIVAAGETDAVLATAAASDYAAGLAQRLGFRHALTTSPENGAITPRNSGTRKRDRVHALLHQSGWHTRPLLLFTDHIDDLPLMRDSDVVCWFGSCEALNAAKTAAGKPHFIACLDLGEQDLQDAIRAFGVTPQTATRSAITVS
jgi:phosphoserine phosphatase